MNKICKTILKIAYRFLYSINFNYTCLLHYSNNGQLFFSTTKIWKLVFLYFENKIIINKNFHLISTQLLQNVITAVIVNMQ